jgi:hypothetical protein
MIDILIIAIGILAGCAIIGLCEIVSGAKELFSAHPKVSSEMFLPVDELKKYLRKNRHLSGVIDALNDQPETTGSFLLCENGIVKYYKTVDKQLDENVSAKGYSIRRGSDTLYDLC